MKQKQGQGLDQHSLTAAGEWCNFERPDIGTGAGLWQGHKTIFRKAMVDRVTANLFDEEARSRFPDMQIVPVAHSFAELLELRRMVLADAAYWESRGLVVNESTLRIAPSSGALSLDEIPGEALAVVDQQLRERYGNDAVRASSAGPSSSAWRQGGVRVHEYRQPPMQTGEARPQTDD